MKQIEGNLRSELYLASHLKVGDEIWNKVGNSNII